MKVPFLDLNAHHAPLKDEVMSEIEAIVDSSAFVMGQRVKAFEEAFAAYCGLDHCVGVANGTDALYLALKAYDIGPGDEVVTAANTFVATAEAIAHTGATPTLVDVDPQTFNIDPSQIEDAISERTKAIVPVHLYGQIAPMDEIQAIAERHDLVVIEDAAQAHGATRNGQRAGSFGHAASFSFYPGKNLGAFGDAGAVVTDNGAIAQQVRRLHDHGGLAKYEHDVVGCNSRLDGIQAGVLSLKLKRLDEANRRRRRNAERYQEILSGIPGLVTPEVPEPMAHVFHLYVVRVENGQREALQRHLHDHGVATGIHYPAPVHLTNAFHSLGYRKGAFPVAEQYAGEILSLPMYPELADEQIDYVAQTIRSFAKAPEPERARP